MELLAPAGNFDCFKAAIANGADAVYLGMPKFGARAFADNFSECELKRVLDYAHLRGVNVYLTVNTLIKNEEADEALKTVEYAFNAGADAFIVQDLALMRLLRKNVSKAALHASTQAGICNVYGAEFLKNEGVTRIVLARESLLKDIEKIKETGLETEVFCQGALCVSYSGNCYYSSLVSGCSGNRGKCLQLCRKKYQINGKSGYFLSAKDICLYDKIELLKSAGVSSLKIEGRMRSPEYVAQAVSVYKAAIDGKKDVTLNNLKTAFNRGDYCKAYLLNPTENVIYDKVQNNMGIKAGKVIYADGRNASIKAEIELNNGDGLKFLHNGYECGGGTVNGKLASYKGRVKAGDEVRLTSSVKLKNEALNCFTTVPVTGELTLDIGKNASLTLNSGNSSVTVYGDTITKAVNNPIAGEQAIKAIGTLGGTDFCLKNININIQSGAFYPLSKIKELRKNGVEELKKAIIGGHSPLAASAINQNNDINFVPVTDNSVFVQIRNLDYLDKIKFNYDRIILDFSDYSNYSEILAACNRLNGKALINLPFISRGEDVNVLLKLKDLPVYGYVANNYSHFKMFENKRFLGGIGLNRINNLVKGSFIASPECDSPTNGLCYAYGKPPYMTVAHCPKKSRGGNCNGCNGYNIEIIDEKGALLRFNRIKQKYCYGVLTPDVPINNVTECKNGKFIDLSYATHEELNELNGAMAGDKYSLKCSHGNYRGKLQ